MALNVLQVSCGPDALSEIREISSAKSAWNILAEKYNVSKNTNSVVLQVLEKDNYKEWSVGVKTYLMAHDLCEIIEATTEPPKQEDDEAAFKAWSKKNSMALHVIQISCGPDTFSQIIEISSAKTAWDKLAEEYNLSNSGSDNNGNVDHVLRHEALKKAVRSGDWNTAEEFLNGNPGATRAQITLFGETALHVAVNAGHEDIVEKLVDLMSEQDMEILDSFGTTALFNTTNAGNYRMAACMARKNRNLLSIIDKQDKQIPVVKAIFNGHIELARYLYSLTTLDDLTPEKGVHGATLCTQAIYTRNLGNNQLFA
ncbi:uncharacterized protein LOC132171529 [Corylus avellana]|uniref:uncharacterized protein LOC132171529 n=1 Tax=Corylus avellana TaxID=13451 RepID=UPI00286CCE03|nr:uncharacterized protein LOC132171529 [Corylus avellana]